MRPPNPIETYSAVQTDEERANGKVLTEAEELILFYNVSLIGIFVYLLR